jgi:hypothetical protein
MEGVDIMKHYFIVSLDGSEEIRVLVRAGDVIEAGQKVIDTYTKAGFDMNVLPISSIERIDIVDVIN